MISKNVRTYLLELNNVWMQKLSMVDNLGLDVLVDPFTSRDELDCDVGTLIHLVPSELDETKRSRI